jgi:hypothetical protein
VLACQDVVERFHLLITLAFVVVEEMGSSGHTMPNRAILVQVRRAAAWGALWHFNCTLSLRCLAQLRPVGWLPSGA